MRSSLNLPGQTINMGSPVAQHPLNHELRAWYIAATPLSGGANTWNSLVAPFSIKETLRDGELDLIGAGPGIWRDSQGFGELGAVRFDSSTRFETPADQNPAIRRHPLTAQVWFKDPGDNRQGALYSAHSSSTNYVSMFAARGGGGETLTARIRSGSTIINGSLQYDETVWNCATLRTTPTAISLFLNGRFDVSDAHDVTRGTMSKLIIGLNPDYQDNYIGLIADVRVSEYAFSDDQIMAMYIESRAGYPNLLNRSNVFFPVSVGAPPVGGRVMSSLVAGGGLASRGGIAGPSGGIAG